MSRKFSFQWVLWAAILISPPASGADELTYCRPNNMVAAHAYIAESLGYFKELQLAVAFTETTHAKICLDALLSGSADVMSGAEGAFIYVTPRNPPLRIIAVTEKNPETALIVGNSNQTPSVAALKGRRIGYLPGSVSYFYLLKSLQASGLQWKDIQARPLQPQTMAAALAGGSVDAISIWEPWAGNALKQAGPSAMLFRDLTLYSYEALLIAHSSSLAAKKPALKKLVQAFLRSEQFLIDHPKEAAEILAKSIAFPAKELEALLPLYTFKLTMHESSIRLLEEELQLLAIAQEESRPQSTVSMEKFFSTEILFALAPDRVSNALMKAPRPGDEREQ